MATSRDAIVVDYESYPKIPKRDPQTHHPIPDPTPEVRDRSAYEYVTFPEKDIFDKPHAPASINGVKYEAGKTYFLAPEFAAELRTIIRTAQRADIRILQSTPDARSVVQSSGNANGATFHTQPE